MAVAVVILVVVGLPALAVTGIGINLYTEHICFSEPLRPEGATSTTAGPRFASPITIECVYEGFGVRQKRDAKPLLYAGGVLGAAGAVIAFAWYWLLLRPWLRHRRQTLGSRAPRPREG